MSRQSDPVTKGTRRSPDDPGGPGVIQTWHNHKSFPKDEYFLPKPDWRTGERSRFKGIKEALDPTRTMTSISTARGAFYSDGSPSDIEGLVCPVSGLLYTLRVFHRQFSFTTPVPSFKILHQCE